MFNRNLELFCISSKSGNYYYSHDNIFSSDCFDAFTTKAENNIENIMSLLLENNVFIVKHKGKEKEVPIFDLKIQRISLCMKMEFSEYVK